MMMERAVCVYIRMLLGQAEIRKYIYACVRACVYIYISAWGVGST